MRCDVMNCDALAARFQGTTCGALADLCFTHRQGFVCRCRQISWGPPVGPDPQAGTSFAGQGFAGPGWQNPEPPQPSPQPSALQSPDLPQGFVPQHVTVARHDQNTLAPPPNRLSVLSFNLQNFTGDHRMGRTNGPIGSPANELRAEIVARLMQVWGIDLLLVMETGSDVSAAMESIRRHAGNAYTSLVSPHTHDTPAATRHMVEVPHPWVRDVLRLRLLSEQFRLDCSDPRHWNEATVFAMLEQLNNCPGAAALLDEPGARFAEIRALRIAISGQILSADAIPGLDCDIPSRPEQVLPWIQAMDLLRDEARLVRFGVRPPSHFDPDTQLRRLMCWIDMLEVKGLYRFLAENPSGAGTIVRHIWHRRSKDMLAVCAVLLVAYRRITLERRWEEPLDQHEDADLYYEALRHFGCVDFHFETYGALFRGTNHQRQEMLQVVGNWSIIRFDDEGNVLDTQRPGSPFNWRSAWRAAVRLPGTRWVEMLLFHTRFTPSREALENEAEDTNVARTLRMRSDSILTVAQAVTDGWGIPIVMCGDFNLPINEGHPVLTHFDGQMQDLGFARVPGRQPLSTLCSPGTIARQGQDFYSAAYDGAYLQGIPDGHFASAIMTIEDIGTALGNALIERLKPYVLAYYRRKMGGLLERLRNRRARLLENLPRNRNVHEAFMTILADLRAVGGIRADLFCLREADFRNLEDRLSARLRAFEARPLAANATADDLAADPVAVLMTQLRELETHVRWNDLDGTRQRHIRDFLAELADSQIIFDNIDTRPAVRWALGYSLVVSDHLPLRLRFDLDRPL